MTIRLIVVWVALISLCESRAELQLPSLKLKGTNQHLDMTRLDVDVQLMGVMAETVIEIEYFNNSHQNAEGEFSLKLPAGSTVSTYALEVNGEMRPAVSVERARALNAYESIKRRNVDPGIVEKMADNIYRTRIFPILPKKPKTVRIGFVHPVPDGKYEFPFALSETLKNLNIKFSGKLAEAPELEINKEMRTHQSEKQEEYSWQFVDIAPRGSLKAQASLIEGEALTAFASSGEPETGKYFFICGKQPPLLKGLPDRWKKVSLIWDASFSGMRRDHDEEITALSKILTNHDHVEVDVYVLGNGEVRTKSFQLEEKNTDKLEKYLREEVNYGGVADFSKLKFDDDSGVVLIVSEGVVPLRRWDLPPLKSAPYLLSSVKGAANIPARHFINVSNNTWFDAFAARDWWHELLFHESIFNETVSLESEMLVGNVGEYFFLAGYSEKARWNSNWNVDIRGIGPVRLERNTELKQEKWNLPRRIYAGQRLLVLEKRGSANEISKWAMQERLASSYTSLIVLEFFEDHLRYRIPPPEPDQLERYERHLRGPNSTLSQKWADKRRWQQERVEWFESDLYEKIQQVEIWSDSQMDGFTDETRNSLPLEGYETWVKAAQDTVDQMEQVNSGADFKKWTQELVARKRQLDNIISETPKVTQKGEVHVSVRGQVSHRGIYTGGEGWTLGEAVAKAGLLNRADSSRVYLYRDTQRTGYRLDHSVTQRVKLQWGDMLVVESQHRSGFIGGNFLSSDPFGGVPADPFSAPAQPARRQQDAIFEERGTFSQRRDLSGRWNEDDAGDNASVSRSIQSRDWKINRERMSHDQWEAFLAAENPSDFVGSYIKANGMLPLGDIVLMAESLYERDMPDAGRMMLWNLLEVRQDRFAGVREVAYWLSEFGQRDEASSLLRELLDSGTLTTEMEALVHFDLGMIYQQSEPFLKCVEIAQSKEELAQLGVIAMTQVANKQKKMPAGLTKELMKSDYRIVVVGINVPYELATGALQFR
ncbi:MAG: VIT domain-containing protein, partial [Verrucomicrobiota bacterium]